jgi:branched-chain amino acid transport system permease protein
MLKRWWLRDLVSLVVFVGIVYGAWMALENATLYWPAMRYYNRIIVLMGINIILAVSLNIINGHAGQFSLGHAGFMAVGAYTAAFLTVKYFAPFVNQLPEGSSQRILWQNLLLLA